MQRGAKVVCTSFMKTAGCNVETVDRCEARITEHLEKALVETLPWCSMKKIQSGTKLSRARAMDVSRETSLAIVCLENRERDAANPNSVNNFVSAALNLEDYV